MPFTPNKVRVDLIDGGFRATGVYLGKYLKNKIG
jgi:hypothetical protein